jgi:catechol-2,3-dioxygenase
LTVDTWPSLSLVVENVVNEPLLLFVQASRIEYPRGRLRRRPVGCQPHGHWNAHSLFFLDPAGNVVEYIARHDLKNGDTAPFGWSDILYASEIGLVVDDVTATTAKLTEVSALTPYKASSGEFAAMGDEYGLLLVMKRGRVVDFTSNPSHGVDVFRTAVTIRGAKASTYQFADYPYLVALEERCSCA